MTMARGPEARVDVPQEVNPLLLLFALTVGVVTWIVHLVGASLLVPAACEHGIQWTINVLTVVTGAACALGIPAATAVIRRAGGGDDARSEVYRTLGWVAFGSNAISLALILAEGLPNLFLGPCP